MEHILELPAWEKWRTEARWADCCSAKEYQGHLDRHGLAWHKAHRRLLCIEKNTNWTDSDSFISMLLLIWRLYVCVCVIENLHVSESVDAALHAIASAINAHIHMYILFIYTHTFSYVHTFTHTHFNADARWWHALSGIAYKIYLVRISFFSFLLFSVVIFYW